MKSPKQTLLALIPVINDLYKSKGFFVTGKWSPPKYNLLSGCYYDLNCSDYDTEMKHIYVNDLDETEKRNYQYRWNLCCKEVDKILFEHFNLVELDFNAFRVLQLKNNII